MTGSLFLLILVFVIINIIQTWLILSYKFLIKGGVIVGLIEAVEVPLIIYLVLEHGSIAFFVVVVTEIIQWLTIAYLTLKR